MRYLKFTVRVQTLKKRPKYMKSIMRVPAVWDRETKEWVLTADARFRIETRQMQLMLGVLYARVGELMKGNNNE